MKNDEYFMNIVHILHKYTHKVCTNIHKIQTYTQIYKNAAWARPRAGPWARRHFCIFVFIFVFVCIFVYLCVYLCIFVYMYVYWILDCWILDLGSWILDFGFWILDFKYCSSETIQNLSTVIGSSHSSWSIVYHFVADGCQFKSEAC